MGKGVRRHASIPLPASTFAPTNHATSRLASLRRSMNYSDGSGVNLSQRNGMTVSMTTLTRAIAISVLMLFARSFAMAQSPADFYKGKNLDILIGYSVGGGYDVYARMIARHLGKHVPGNPNVVPKNMEGAGSLRLANWLYNVAAKDGTVMATIGPATRFDPLLGHKAAQFDGNKFTWIGSANDEVSVCVSWNKPGNVSRFDELYTRQLTVGGTGAAADTDQFPRILNSILGTKMKIVTGYP